MDVGAVVVVGRLEEVVEVGRDAAEAAARVERRLQHQARARRRPLNRSAHARGVPVAEGRARHVGAVPVRVVALGGAGAAERVELGHAAGKRGMDVARGALVEAGVGHGDDLAVALVVGAVDDDVRVEDGPGDVVEQLPRRDLLDVVHLVERGQLGELALLYGQAHLAPPHLHVVGVHAGGGRDVLFHRFGIDVVVEHDVDLSRLARRRARNHGGKDRRCGVGRRGPQRRRDLEPLQVDVGPDHERQRPDRLEVARAVAAQVGVLRDVLLDLDAQPGQLLLLLLAEGLAGLDEDVVGLRGVRRLQPGSPERVRLRDRVQGDAVDGDEGHTPTLIRLSGCLQKGREPFPMATDSRPLGVQVLPGGHGRAV